MNEVENLLRRPILHDLKPLQDIFKATSQLLSLHPSHFFVHSALQSLPLHVFRSRDLVRREHVQMVEATSSQGYRQELKPYAINTPLVFEKVSHWSSLFSILQKT